MKRLMKRLSALAVAGALLGGGLVTVAAGPASATEGVVVVQSKSDAPKETVWSPGVPNPETCMVTDTGVLTVPGQRHETETELRAPYKQVIPGQTELTHQEYKYSRTVAVYKTQYFFAKFTHTKTRTWVKEIPARAATYVKWVWNGGNTATAPAFPGPYWNKTNDTNPNKHDPRNTVYKTGNGTNASWAIYAETSPAVPAVPGYWSAWSDYGPWTLWQPVQHTSWQDSNAPIGSPEFHGQGSDWYREWQQRPTGETRQVPNGSHVENTDWLTAPPAGEGWTQVDVKTVKDREATADKTVYFLPGGEPTATLTDANYTATNPGSPWVKAGDDKRFETKAAYSDPDVVTNYSHTFRDPGCASNVSFIETSHVQYCGGVDITLRNVSPWIYPTSVEIDGVHSYGPTVDNRTNGTLTGPVQDQSRTRSITFEEDSGTHEVRYRVQAGTEKDLYVGLPVNEWTTVTVETDCTPNEVPANAVASITAVCGAATITLTNPQAEWNINQTASFVIYVDGSFYSAHAVVADDSETVNLTFPEDSGDHTVQVRTGPAFGDELLDEATVTSDCILPQPEDDVVYGEWSEVVIDCTNEVGDELPRTRTVTTTEFVLVDGEWGAGESVETTEEGTYVVTAEDVEALNCPVVVPPTEEPTPPVTTPEEPKTDAPAPAKAAVSDDGILAITGADTGILWTASGVGLVLAAAGILILMRRKLKAPVDSE